MEHREKLERLQEEQKALLELEREKRMEFEKQQEEKEIQLTGKKNCFIHTLNFAVHKRFLQSLNLKSYRSTAATSTTRGGKAET